MAKSKKGKYIVLSEFSDKFNFGTKFVIDQDISHMPQARLNTFVQRGLVSGEIREVTDDEDETESESQNEGGTGSATTENGKPAAKKPNEKPAQTSAAKALQEAKKAAKLKAEEDAKTGSAGQTSVDPNKESDPTGTGNSDPNTQS